MNNDYTITAFAAHLANIGYQLAAEWNGGLSCMSEHGERRTLAAAYVHPTTGIAVAVYTNGDYQAATDEFAHNARWTDHQGICELSVLTSHLAAGHKLERAA